MLIVVTGCVLGNKITWNMLVRNSSCEMVKLRLSTFHMLMAAVTDALPVLVGNALLGIGGVPPPRWMALEPVESNGRNSFGAGIELVAGHSNKGVERVANIFDFCRCEFGVIFGRFGHR